MCLASFGTSLLTLWTLETYFELENIPSTHLLAWLCILVRLSEIQVHCFESTWSIELLRIACNSWVFPDILDGLELRWCWAHDWRLFRASPSDCEGFLSLLRRSSRIGYSSGARGLEDLHLVSGCAAPAEGLTLVSQLARNPSSGCIATTRTSLTGSKWTSVKILVLSLC
jgi:hypothetical protein